MVSKMIIVPFFFMLLLSVFGSMFFDNVGGIGSGGELSADPRITARGRMIVGCCFAVENLLWRVQNW